MAEGYRNYHQKGADIDFGGYSIFIEETPRPSFLTTPSFVLIRCDAYIRIGMSKPRDAEEGHVTVCVRARPLNEREKRLNSPICLQFQNGKTVSIYKSSVPNGAAADAGCDAAGGKCFSFDRAFDSNDSQTTVYEYLGIPVLQATIKGFNACVFAYGQSGSGKSYSMMGPSGGRDVVVDPGIIPRLSRGLFEMVAKEVAENEREREAARSSGVEENALPPQLNITVLVSYMEIYQERVNCLLNPKCENLKVREHKVLGVYVEGISEVQVDSEESMMQVMHGGNQSRHIAATNMNDRSSRSHAIFSITVIQKRMGKVKDGTVSCTELRAKVNLVDLAGSERAKSTGAEGGTLREGANINKSLTVLGQVISALADIGKSKPDAGGRRHVPYRDSTLTFILKESLGGNSKTFMLSTLSPAAANYDETMSTLRYADRAKSIVTRAVVNAAAGDKRIRELEEEVQQLREKMKHYEELALRGGVMPDLANPGGLPNSAGGGHGPASNMEDLESSIPSMTPRRPHDAAVLLSKLEQAEELIKQLTKAEGKQQEAPRPTHPTIKLDRNEPFILNMEGVGDWVVEHLVAGTTYLGTEEPTPGSEWRSITVSGEGTSGVAPRHCCFVRQGNGCVLLRPLEGNLTYINDEQEPISRDVPLMSGTVVCIGDEFLQFKFTDPTAPSMTARRRPMRSAEGTILSPRFKNISESSVPSLRIPAPTQSVGVGITTVAATNSPRGGIASSAANTGNGGSAAPVVPPITAGSGVSPFVPALQLKDVLQHQAQTNTYRPPTHKDPVAADVRPTSVRLPRTAKGVGRSRIGAGEGMERIRAVKTARRLKLRDDEYNVIYRHTFLVLGCGSCGKTSFRENLHKQDKWYSIFTSDQKNLRPSFGVESTTISSTGEYPSVEMNVMELGGTGCFSLLQGLLPTRRATYVLCFSLLQSVPFEGLLPFLEFILSHTTTRDTSVVLVGTYLDRSPLKSSKLAQHFSELEMQVNNYFRTLQVVGDMRPSIAGCFAVDNVNRTVFAPMFERLRKFPDLLSWFGDQAIRRCRNDADFPNAQVPKLLLSLGKRTKEINREGKWCVAFGEFKSVANALDNRYSDNLDDLHRHIQLLMSWGVLHHHYRHRAMRKYVIVDTPWVFRVVATLSCCSTVTPKLPGNDSSLRSVPLVLCREVMQSMRKSLPFDVDAVLIEDVCGALLQGVLTMRTALALFDGVLKEKGYGFAQLGGLLELLRSYDFIIMGSRLQYSFFNDENTSVQSSPTNAGKDMREVGSGLGRKKSAGPSGGPESEHFVLIPSCFMNPTPSSFCMHVPSFLHGPFYRFTLNMVPHNFFSRIVSRVAHCAKKVYLGPATARCVKLEDLVWNPNSQDDGKGGNRVGSNVNGSSNNTKGTEPSVVATNSVYVVGSSQFWENTMWVISSPGSRALLRMVQRSLFVTFHDMENSDEFYDGLRHVIRNILYESPGVTCQESILCLRRALEDGEKAEEVHGDLTYWRHVDENVNSLEKIKQREATALMTPRGTTPRLSMKGRAGGTMEIERSRQGGSRAGVKNGSGNSDEEDELNDVVIPFVRNHTEPIDVEAALRRVCSDSLLTDNALNELKTALQAMKEARSCGDHSGECCALDRLVDVLAQT